MSSDREHEIAVVKAGSSSLVSVGSDGAIELNLDTISRLCKGIIGLRESGTHVVLVSSGAVAAGMAEMGLQASERPTDSVELARLSSIGQAILISAYKDELRKYDVTAAQILTDRAMFRDIAHRPLVENLQRALLVRGDLPIINENDAIAENELKYGDNDFTAALEAVMLHARYLVLFTETQGLMDGDPSLPTTRLIEEIDNVDEKLFDAVGTRSALGSFAGPRSKIYACDIARHCGTHAIVANIDNADKLDDVVSGSIPATRFILKNDGPYPLHIAYDILERFAGSHEPSDVAQYFSEIN